MKRHTTLSVLAAMAFGVAMAAASSASYARAPTGQYGDDPIRRCEREYNACLSACRPGDTPPEQIARCQSECRERDAQCMSEIGFVRAGAPASRQAQGTLRVRAP